MRSVALDFGCFRAFHPRKADFHHKSRHALSAVGGDISILTNGQLSITIKCVTVVKGAGTSALFVAQQHVTVVSR